jgi:hypothetical protein
MIACINNIQAQGKSTRTQPECNTQMAKVRHITLPGWHHDIQASTRIPTHKPLPIDFTNTAFQPTISFNLK